MMGTSASAADNPVFEELTTAGIAVTSRESLRLPPPTLKDGLDATAQRKVIEAAAEGKQSWETLTRRSVVAPFLLKITGGDQANQGQGRRVDLSFVAYGELGYLGSDEFLGGRFISLTDSDNSQPGNRALLLSDEALQARNMPPPTRASDPRWLAAEFTFLDRVEVRGTTQSVRTSTRDSLLIASKLDSTFERDAQYPNAWRSIMRNESGREFRGDWQTYSGLGSYVKVTRLVEPSGALFVEYHVAFAEPQGWFRGANLLRSKLPIVAQDLVRKFRRHLATR